MSELEVVKLLQACRVLARRLSENGIDSPLTQDEKNLLDQFNQLQKLYAARDLRFMSEKGGLKPFQLGLLKVRLKLEAQKGDWSEECYRCGGNEISGHHYLCLAPDGDLAFPNINDRDMRALIQRVVDIEKAKQTEVKDNTAPPAAFNTPERRPLLKNLPIQLGLIG